MHYNFVTIYPRITGRGLVIAEWKWYHTDIMTEQNADTEIEEREGIGAAVAFGLWLMRGG